VKRWAIAVAAVWLCGSTMLPAQTQPRPQEFADAFRSGDYDRFKALIANERMGMLDRVGNVIPLTRDDLVDRLRPCTVNQVFEAGVHFQTLSGVEWICRGQPVAGEPCEAVAYGINLFPLGDRFRLRVYLTTTYDLLACPSPGPAAPAPARIRSDG
jgi:hypothetical protein